MTSARSYKKALPPEQARYELSRNAGTQFDPDVVRAFLNVSVGRLHLAGGPLAWLSSVPGVRDVATGPLGRRRVDRPVRSRPPGWRSWRSPPASSRGRGPTRHEQAVAIETVFPTTTALPPQNAPRCRAQPGRPRPRADRPARRDGADDRAGHGRRRAPSRPRPRRCRPRPAASSGAADDRGADRHDHDGDRRRRPRRPPRRRPPRRRRRHDDDGRDDGADHDHDDRPPRPDHDHVDHHDGAHDDDHHDRADHDHDARPARPPRRPPARRDGAPIA